MRGRCWHCQDFRATPKHITDPAAWEPNKARPAGRRHVGTDAWATTTEFRPAIVADVEGLATSSAIAFSDPGMWEQLSNALSWLGARGLVAEDAAGTSCRVVGGACDRGRG